MSFLLTKQTVIYLLTYSLNKYLLNSDYIPDTVTEAKDRFTNKM